MIGDLQQINVVIRFCISLAFDQVIDTLLNDHYKTWKNEYFTVHSKSDFLRIQLFARLLQVSLAVSLQGDSHIDVYLTIVQVQRKN